MGAALGGGFQNLATDLALAAFGIAVLAIVVLGIGLMLGIFDRFGMQALKDGLLRVIGGSALVGGAATIGAFVVSNFKF